MNSRILIALLSVGLGLYLYQIFFSTPRPQVVVYLDKDAKSPASLPLPSDTQLSGDRAALWWSVFNKTLEVRPWPGEAADTADRAVRSVYGPSPKTP